MKENQEFYHTFERYQEQGLEPFVQHALQYLRGERTVPVSKPNVLLGMKEVLLTFSDKLLHNIVDTVTDLRKPYEVAIKYGFRGHTNGGINGIFFQERESSLGPKTTKLIQPHETRLQQDLDISLENLDSLINVKVVWHEPSGKRIVGVYNMNNNRIFLLDFAHY
ncbi:hypothetical protein HQ489_00325 [Candidatus Woesearchaeota archaeon]|nr:hypothetical protein [Candidatus Woesearchaeota archaeon]